MGDIFYIILIDFVVLLAVIYRNFSYSHELLVSDGLSKTIYLSVRIRKFLLLQNWGKSTGRVRLLGFWFYVLTAYFSLILALPVILCSLIRIAKIIFGLHFTWFTTSILGLIGSAIMCYSGVMHAIFSILDWFSKKKG